MGEDLKGLLRIFGNEYGVSNHSKTTPSGCSSEAGSGFEGLAKMEGCPDRFFVSSAFWMGHHEQYSIWLETTNLSGGLNHYGNRRKVCRSDPFAGICEGPVQGHARSFSS